MNDWLVIGLAVLAFAGVGGGVRFWLKNSILKNKIELMERERAQLVESLRAAQLSPESARIIEQMTKHIELLEGIVKRRDIRIKELEKYVERLLAAWGRLNKTLARKGFVIGLEIPPSPQRQRAELAQQMNTHLALDELQTICLALDVDYENLEPGGKMAKIVSLIQKLYQQDRLGELRQWLAKRRPETTWLEA